MAGDPITALADLVRDAFKFATDPGGFENMKLEHQIEVVHAAIVVARAARARGEAGADNTLDALFDRYRELSKSAGS